MCKKGISFPYKHYLYNHTFLCCINSTPKQLVQAELFTIVPNLNISPMRHLMSRHPSPLPRVF